MKKCMFIVSLLACCMALFAQQGRLEDYVSGNYLNELKSNGKVEIIHEEKDTSLNLIPNTSYKSRIDSQKIAKGSKNVPFVAEFLYLVPKSELKAKGSRKLDNVTIDEVSTVFRSISKMQGMQYDFNKAGKGKVLYEKVHMISSLSSDAPIPDQNTGNANGQVSYCYQDDDVYGDLKFTLNYFQEGNVLYSTFLLGVPMYRLGVKAVDPSNLKISIMAIDVGDSLLLYLTTDVAANSIPLVNVRKEVQDSMIARMDAVYRWFLTQF